LRKKALGTWVFWVHAGSKTTFVHSYHEIANAANVPGREDPKADVLDLVFRWLKRESSCPWLMVVDNNDDAELLFTIQEQSDLDQAFFKRSKLHIYNPVFSCFHFQ
jgi:hypothetical protein